MTQPTQNYTENEALGAFAGLVILIVILAILFIVTTPDGLSGEAPVEADDVTQVAAVAGTETDAATAEVDTSAEATAEADEVTEEAAPTEAEVTPTEADEMTEEATPTEAEAAPTEATEEPAEVADAGTETSADGTASAETDYDPELVARGEQLFATCAACHGPDARGIQGLGKDLVEGEFASSATDEELISVITSGRPIWDPANTTGVDMPPKGGNPTLTSEDIEAIVAYIRSLQSS